MGRPGLALLGFRTYQFCYLTKKCPDDIQSKDRADRKKTHEERTDNIYYIFL